jgi:hypothetical protein
MDTTIGNSVPVSRIPRGPFTGKFDNQSEGVELAKGIGQSVGQGVIGGMGPGVAQRLTRRMARRVTGQMLRRVAWLASRQLWSPRVIAAAPGLQIRLTSELEGVQREMKARTSCDIAIGAARSRSVARTASRVAGSTVAATGTAGVLVVSPGQERAFLAPLPLRRLDGVPEAALRVLRASGLVTIGELQKVPKAALQAEFGPQEGLHVWRTARGIDTQPASGARSAPSRASWHELLFRGRVFTGKVWRQLAAQGKALNRDAELTSRCTPSS